MAAQAGENFSRRARIRSVSSAAYPPRSLLDEIKHQPQTLIAGLQAADR
ncbi:hypothetical protein ACWDHW_34915 [Streptomyces melanosporofaciens]